MQINKAETTRLNMTNKIGEGLLSWLDRLSQSWHLTVPEVASKLAEDEIGNRVLKYPKLRDLLGSVPFNLGEFASAARECWVLGGRFDSVRFNSFIAKGREASDAIERFIIDFSENDRDAAKRIDDFVEDAVILVKMTTEN
jgi:hypothetical protein